MSESFQKAVDDVKVLKTGPEKPELGELYALYKQAMVGDINVGLSKQEAMDAYVEVVEKLKRKYGIKI